jgi:cell division protein ZapA
MSNVTLTIGGRHYTVACATGEEAHIANLGASIDAKLAGMAGLAKQSEPRTLLYAALLLADELYEARQSVPAHSAGDELEQSVEALETVAERLEDLAERLENGKASS